MKYAFLLCVPFTLLACSSPPKPEESPDLELQSLEADLSRVEEALERVGSSLGHLETEISASQAEDEFAELAIDALEWPSEGAGYDESSHGRAVWCHVTEWRGFGKQLRFTRLADPVLFFEAEGRRPISAKMSEGGVCSEDGSTRYVVLYANADFEPGVDYHLRARNETSRYRWRIDEDVLLASR